MKIVRQSFVLFGALMALLFCLGCSDGVREPVRPAELPNDAVYAWNGHSGEWVACQVTGASSITCDRFNEGAGEFDLRVHLRICMNLEIVSELDRSPAVPLDIGDAYAIFTDVRFFHEQKPEYIGSSDHASDRVQAILRSSELAFQEYGVSANCESLGTLVVEIAE